jgi:DNA-binding response OmpR family regulator
MMREKRVLVVDDERSIRLTVQRALEPLKVLCDEAVNGEDAQEKIQKQAYDLVLLDLKMPGTNGMEVLKRLRDCGSPLKVVIITAHGSIDNAVEAMKLGAIDFIQKPFSPDQIRRIVSQALRRDKGFLRKLRPVPGEDPQHYGHVIRDEELRRIKAEMGSQEETDYEFCLEQAKAAVEGMEFDSAEAWTQKAVAADPGRPEGFNFLGVFCELRDERLKAQKYYRAALALDPTYRAAQNNLHRSTGLRRSGTLDLGGDKEKPRNRQGLRTLIHKLKSSPEDEQ